MYVQEVNNREIRYLPDLTIVNLLPVFILVQKLLNYFPNYPTHSLYFGEVETPHCHTGKQNISTFTACMCGCTSQ